MLSDTPKRLPVFIVRAKLSNKTKFKNININFHNFQIQYLMNK